MDFTGERYLPCESDPFDELAVEHRQRYHSIRKLVAGKIVLDAACGEGYGADLLAGTARRVVGIDISLEAMHHARSVYTRANLEYLVGSIADLPFADHSFDAVISFEVIEHLEEELQSAFLREIRRVLTREGLLVISTPNKAVYTDRSGLHNRFHKKEFLIGEFESFLRRFFPQVSLYGQSWHISSVLGRPGGILFDNPQIADPVPFNPKYVVAVCGACGSADGIELSSAVMDQSGKLEGMSARIVALQDEVAEKNAWVIAVKGDLQRTEGALSHYKRESETLAQTAAALTEEVNQLRARLEATSARLAEAEQTIRMKADAIAVLEQYVQKLNSEIASLLNVIRGKDADLDLLRTELDLIKRSDFWRIASRYWLMRDALLPLGSKRRRRVKQVFKVLKHAAQAPRRRTAIGPPEPAGKSDGGSSGQQMGETVLSESCEAQIEFTCADQPELSVIIPVFNQWEITYRCLKSLCSTPVGMPYEVILADDASTDKTGQAEKLLAGVRVLHGEKNRGFLRNCNWAASHARGQFLYFLNNDTELRLGAIQALVSLLERDPMIGMAGSKLVFPDGRLQEAGGIIWADGSGWNFGKGQNPDLPAFNYVKEVDYVSGASLMIRKSVWNEIGGFDERYAPAYCEDSDLAFEVRKRGLKVVYQPNSVVVHYEGASHGNDVAQSTKAHQVSNTQTLRTKWAEVLAGHLPNGADVFHARDRSAGRKTILMIDHYVPQFDRDAGSRTIWSFIQAFLKMGMNVKFLGDNFYPHQPYTDILRQSGVEVLTGPWIASNWPEWLADNGRYLDYVFLNRPHITPKYLNPVRKQTRAKVLYYVHDLHYLRESKLADLTNDAALKARVGIDRRREQRLMGQMDVIFSCSCYETGIIRELCPDVDVFYVPPYAVDVDLVSSFRPEERADLLFVGGFSHPPNVDGVLWFVREVWPAVREQLPGVVFNIAGSDPPPEVRALASDDVKVLGFVTDERLQELYSHSRLAVIPLRYGGGVKGKTVEAMAHGVPIAATDFGFEGIPGIDEIIVPMQVKAPLAEGIVALYNDFETLAEISMKQRAFVSNHFNLEKIRASFAQAVMVSPPAVRTGSRQFS